MTKTLLLRFALAPGSRPFRRADEKITELTPKFVGVAYPFLWHEDHGTVEAQFEKEHMSMLFPLQ